MPHKVHVRHLGRTEYGAVFAQMQAYTSARNEQSADELWLTEHHPVFTQGQAGKAEHLLAPGDIPIVQTDRGGQVTYHGPGQLVGYLLFDLKRMGIGVKALVRGIEDAVIETLAAYAVSGSRREDAPGVYVNGDKIGALGLRVKRGCSYHGLSLNVQMDLEPFARINPCGLTDIGVTQIADFPSVGPPLAEGALMLDVADQLLAALRRSYDLRYD